MAQVVLTPNNFGSTIDTTSEAGKFNVKVDNSTIVKDVNGTLSAVIPPAAAETTTTMVYDSDTHVLTYTNEVGTVSTVDLTPFLADVNLDGIVDNGNGTYTFTQDEGGPSVTLDLSEFLKGVAHADTATVSMTGAGTVADPLEANVRLSTAPGNRLRPDPDGVYVGLETTEELTEWGTNTVLGYIRPA